MSLKKLLPMLTLLSGTLLLSACLVRIAYNNADWLLIWKIDDAIGLNTAQKDFLITHLKEHLRWHRETELEKTIAFLRRTQTAAATGVSKFKIEGALSEYAQLRNALATHGAADSAEFFAQISDEQVDNLQKSLQNSNKDWERRAKLPPRSRSADRTERVLDMITDWTGSLSSTQERQLTLSIEHLPDVLDIWLAHTKERQRQFVEIVRSARGDRAAASQALLVWITAETLPPQLAAHRSAVYDLIIEVDRLCTKAQRDHAVRKLQTWIDDLQLAKDQGAT